jgi:hypothetical protein
MHLAVNSDRISLCFYLLLHHLRHRVSISCQTLSPSDCVCVVHLCPHLTFLPSDMFFLSTVMFDKLYKYKHLKLY